MERLKFSYNWNNKLTSGAFTTIRLWNPKKYKIGNQVSVVLVDKKGIIKTDYGTATMARVYPMKMEQLTEYICRLDTGYSREQTKNILRLMYPKTDWNFQTLALVLLIKDKETPDQKSLFNN